MKQRFPWLLAGLVLTGVMALLAIVTPNATRSQGSTTPTPLDPTQAAQQRLRDFMNDLDPAITVKVGDMLPDLTLPIAYPDGSTRTESLRKETAGHRTILYFYFQDNTPL